MDASTARAGTVEVLADFALSSETGNERVALARVADAVRHLGLPTPRLEALKTAVAEATMNAIEHGNGNRPELPVLVQVTTGPGAVTVSITDKGGVAAAAAAADPAVPDLSAKLAGLQSPRGWGLFLIRNMVDEMSVLTEGDDHTVLLTLQLADRPAQPTPSEDGDAEHL
jgi:anti-sigma regulatory factor (Ser/Thr protein kinase)